MIPTKSISDTDYADDIALLANTPTPTKSLLHSLEQAAGDIGLLMNADKTEYMCFNQEGDISTLSGSSLKLVDKFTYLSSSILSTESDFNLCRVKTWTAINRLLNHMEVWSIQWIKMEFLPSSGYINISLCTTWMLRKSLTGSAQESYELH